MSIKDYEDLTPKLVDRAKAGDRNAALRVLEVFVAAVEKDQQPHPSVMTYLSKAFQDILDEVDVTSALHLLKPHLARAAIRCLEAGDAAGAVACEMDRRHEPMRRRERVGEGRQERGVVVAAVCERQRAVLEDERVRRL